MVILSLSFLVAAVALEHDVRSISGEATFRATSMPLRSSVMTIFGPSASPLVGSKSGFGTTIRSNGDLWAVSAPHYGATDMGAIFLYDANNMEKWSLLGYPLEAIGGRFALSGNSIAIGRKSSIEVYNAYTAMMRGKPVTSMPGNDVTIANDEVLIIGEDRFNERQGQVRILRYNETNDAWTPQQTLPGMNLSEGRYGWVVAASKSGDRIAISAPNASPDFYRQGYVHVIQRDGRGLWESLGSILYGEVENGQFGFALAMSGDGNTVVVGAPGTLEGGVYAYRLKEKEWVQMGSVLTAKGSGLRFGRAVAVSNDGNRIAGTSPFYDNARGHTRVFDFINNEWVEKFNLEGIRVGDWLGWGNFGLDLSPDGFTLTVGSTVPPTIEGNSTGAVHIYNLRPESSPSPSNTPSRSPNHNLEPLGPYPPSHGNPTMTSQAVETGTPSGRLAIPTWRPTHLVIYNSWAPIPEPPQSASTPTMNPTTLSSTSESDLPSIRPTQLKSGQPPTQSIRRTSMSPIGEVYHPSGPISQAKEPISFPQEPTNFQTYQRSSNPSTKYPSPMTVPRSDLSKSPLLTTSSGPTIKPSTDRPTVSTSLPVDLTPRPSLGGAILIRDPLPIQILDPTPLPSEKESTVEAVTQNPVLSVSLLITPTTAPTIKPSTGQLKTPTPQPASEFSIVMHDPSSTRTLIPSAHPTNRVSTVPSKTPFPDDALSPLIIPTKSPSTKPSTEQPTMISMGEPSGQGNSFEKLVPTTTSSASMTKFAHTFALFSIALLFRVA